MDAHPRTDAIVVRTATEADVDPIVDLQVERNGAEWGPMVRSLLTHPDFGPRLFTVATDGDRVVSSLCLLPECLRLGTVHLPIGQPEFVATAPTHTGRGLVRAQMDVVHRWSAERGELVQVIGGIPFFYRKFGYEYAVAFPRVRLVDPGVTLAMPEGWSVRRAGPEDVNAVAALQARAGASASLATTRTETSWRSWLGVDLRAPWHVAEHTGTVRGSACIGDGAPGLGADATTVRAVAHDSPDVLDALLAEAAGRGKAVVLEERPPHTGPAAAVSHRTPATYALYVRVADPVALLDRLRPVLSARLEDSPYADRSGQLLLSLYSTSIIVTYERAEVVSVAAGPPEQDPVEEGGAGVPPDLIATLVFGRYGAAGLAARHDDVRLGRVGDLMETLFPRLHTDVCLAG